MKTHHQNTWQFAKLFLAALVFAFGVVACGGGGGGSSSSGGGGGGNSMNVLPSGYQLAITNVSISAATPAPAAASGAGTLAARSAFVPAADDVDLVVSVTVKNSGGNASPVTSFELYRSVDAVLESSDKNEELIPVPAVAADGIQVVIATFTTEMLPADPASPTHFIAAGQFGDETLKSSDEVANDFRGVEVYSTDGVVISNGSAITGANIVAEFDYDWSASGVAKVDSASVPVGEQITVTVDVTNKSAFRAPSASLSFYRSSTSAITFSGTGGIGVASISALATGGVKPVSFSVSAPDTTGNYFYGACIVATDDSDLTNDCSTGVQVTVTPKYGVVAFEKTANGEEWFGDTSINQPTVALAYSEAIRLCGLDGGTNCEALVTFTAHVAYAGGVKSDDDTRAILAWATGNTLARAESAALAKCVADGGADSGTYACAPLGNFSDEYDNSHSNSPAVDGTETSGSEEVATDVGDFELSAIAFSINPKVASDGEYLTFITTIGNAVSATASSPWTVLHYYFAFGGATEITGTSDTNENASAYDLVDPLLPGETKVITYVLALGSSGHRSNYYWGGCIEESNLIHDCTEGVQVEINWLDMDLSVTAFTISPASVTKEGTITVNATVANASSATVASPAADLDYYVSSDSTISTSDTYLDSDDVSALSAGQTSNISTSLTAPDTAGTYYVGACVIEDETFGATFVDTDTSNNCSAGVQLVVTEN